MGLPRRWAGQARFVILETGFGLGHNFLATWQAWCDDPAPCDRLCYVAIDPRPPSGADLEAAHGDGPLARRAAALAANWPPPTANLHALDFEDGRVQLLLAVGEPGKVLPALSLQADAIILSSPGADLRILKALGRKSAPGATLAAGPLDGAVLDGLRSSGFAVPAATAAGQAAATSALFAPGFQPRGAPRRPAAAAPRTALVIGAGVAGAAAARGLLLQGLQVTVLDRLSAPAGGASGNPVALVHGTVNPDDGPYARLFRSAALHAQRCYRDAARLAPGLADMTGLLRMELAADAAPAMRATLAGLGLPPDYVQVLDASAAAALAGVPLQLPGWLYPGGGWVRPADWVRLVLQSVGVRFQGEAEVAGIRQAEGAWQACDRRGSVLAQADVLVLACTAQSAALLQPWLAAGWPLSATRGQVTLAALQTGAPGLVLPLAGDGYAIPMPGGQVLCGATRHAGPVGVQHEPLAVDDEDHRHNLQRLQRLTGLRPQGPLRGRSAWRLHSDDRLPIAGAVAVRDLPAAARRDQARWLPRVPGLFVLTALGARGLTLAPLLGLLVAAQATGAPWPLEQALADAVDPARWLVRGARHGTAPSDRMRDRGAGQGKDEEVDQQTA